MVWFVFELMWVDCRWKVHVFGQYCSTPNEMETWKKSGFKRCPIYCNKFVDISSKQISLNYQSCRKYLSCNRKIYIYYSDGFNAITLEEGDMFPLTWIVFCRGRRRRTSQNRCYHIESVTTYKSIQTPSLTMGYYKIPAL